jgi:hypothetical protein
MALLLLPGACADAGVGAAFNATGAGASPLSPLLS